MPLHCTEERVLLDTLRECVKVRAFQGEEPDSRWRGLLCRTHERISYHFGAKRNRDKALAAFTEREAKEIEP